MKAILIDPILKEVKEVDYSGDYTDIYKLIECRTFDIVRIPVGNDGIYIDDEGLFTPINKQHWFTYRYNAHEMHQNIPLVNKGLVIGWDDEGNSIDCDSTVDSIKSSVRWGLYR